MTAYRRPGTIEEALALLREHGDEAHVLAGGTALTLLRKQGLIEGGVIVDLDAIRGLDTISRLPQGGLTIGAMATLRRVETNPLVLAEVPALAAVVGRVATIRIRNQATLGGNLAHADPAQDPPPILIVLDAQVEVAGTDGRRLEPVERLFVDVFETSLAAAELLVAVRVPRPSRTSRIGYEKFLPRTADDYATVAVAARLDLGDDGTVADARIALGGVAGTPLRVREAESLLRGTCLDDLPVDAVADAVRAGVDPVDDARGSAGYKREMAGVWTARLIRRLSGLPVAA